MDLTSLAGQVGLPVSTAFRLLETLRSGDMVRVSRDGYTVGAKSFQLSGAFLRTVSVWSHATELAERLAATVGETASVGILEDHEYLYIAIAQGQHELGIQSVAGTRHPAYATALGKVLLARLPWSEVEQNFRTHPPERLTQRSITDAVAFRTELERVAREGYAVDDEERQPGVTCVAAPIRVDRGEVVAAISISGPTDRIKENGIRDMAQVVTAQASEASQLLGLPGHAGGSSPTAPGEGA